MIELTVTTLAHGGAGLGHHDGKAVFVFGAIPGDRIRCHIVQNKKRYARADLVEILDPSDLRQEPACSHFGDCGGCDWQQLSYEQQCQWKQRLFADSCVRHGHIEQGSVRAFVPAPQEFGYRSRVQFKCGNAAQGFVLGFYRRGSHDVIDVRQCPVVAPPIAAQMTAWRTLFDGSVYASFVSQIDVAVGCDDALRTIVHYHGTETNAFCSWLAGCLNAVDGAVLVQSGHKSGKSALTVLRGQANLAIRVDDPPLELHYGPGGFAQVNLAQNRQLVARVIEAAEVTAEDCVLDLYCGMGNFSLPLARCAGEVVGVEDYAPSIASAADNRDALGLDNATFHACSVKDFLGRWKRAADVIVLDPPRSGARDAVAGIMGCRPRRIVYVSCDQQTLMRDITALAQAYTVTSIQALDMFPQTCHTEVLAVLDRRQG
ncbi:class I SAM-dependent RNA methyltransferase [uncultured Desulfuromonas sp.]|uniref:class I SAM-dependent RNA methyltransferase n=1 Tax=uncultured Desulfuromonas sp. TaxID=181013 RepID=UPI002AAB54E2|nr:class I SAM-dependent RNA methyltransferase [uncultured Desulfuromonas sp.]